MSEVAAKIRQRKRANKPARTLQEQLLQVFIEHVERWVYWKRPRRQKNGEGLPLTTWLGAARSNLDSKILAICADRVRQPRISYRGANAELARRIARRFSLTWQQLYVVEQILGKRYRGTPEYFPMYMHWLGYVNDDWVGENLAERNLAPTPWNAIWDACMVLKISPRDLPLGAVIDPRTTNIILMMQLNDTLQRMPKKRKKE